MCSMSGGGLVVGKTKIEWVVNPDGSRGMTWNPVVGCSPISSGCKNCYALRMAKRLRGIGLPQYQNVVDSEGWTGKTEFVRNALDNMHGVKKASMVFVCSMGDLFHESVDFLTAAEILGRIRMLEKHTFVILTKRPHRIKEFWGWMNSKSRDREFTWPSNCLSGVSVENQPTANERIPFLAELPGFHLVSYEPAIGPVNFIEAVGEPDDLDWDAVNEIDDGGEPEEFIEECEAEGDWINCGHDLVENPEYTEHRRWREMTARLNKLKRAVGWIVAGAETGPGARVSHPDRFRRVRDECQMAGIPFLFKSWGEWAPNGSEYREMVERWRDTGRLHENVFKYDDGTIMVRVGRRHSGRLLDGTPWNEMPEITP